MGHEEIFRHIEFGVRLVPSLLIIILACVARKLAGKGWLVTTVSLDLIWAVGYEIVNLDRIPYEMREPWYSVLALIGLFGFLCFVLFVFSNYFVSRLNLDVTSHFFSFSGRIPRSVFWIALCILFSFNLLIGIVPLLLYEKNSVEHTGVPYILFWVIYVCLAILLNWISLALYAKRWHDCSKSGWTSLIFLIPIVGLIAIFYLGFTRGDEGANEYGDSPFNLQPKLADAPLLPAEN